MIKILELFAGIGAASKALSNLGIDHEIVDAVEIDKYAIKSFNAVHGTNFEPQDITTWDKDIECDLIMHGSPCQDFSIAGKQAGGDEGTGTRSSLMYETLRIVEKLRPKYVIWENVKNLLSKKHRHNFDAYQQAMEQLGYINTYKVLNAKDYGVPQNRERVFTVSIRVDLFKQTNGSLVYDAMTFVFPEPIPLEKKLKDVLETEVDEKYYLSDRFVKGLLSHNEKHSAKGTGFLWKERDLDGVASTLRVNAALAPTDNTIRVVGKLDIKGQDQIKRVYDSGGVSPTLSTMQGGNRQPKIIDDAEPFIVASRGRNPANPSDRTPGAPTEQRLEPKFDGTTNTLTSVQKDNYVATPYRIRKLTPKDFLWHNGLYEKRYKECKEILPILWGKIGEEAFCEWAIRGLWCILSEAVLWERVYAKSIFESWCERPELVKFAYFGKGDKPTSPTQEVVRNMWINWQDRYPSYRRELSEQQFKQLKSVVQKLPHEVASFQGFVQSMWETYEGSGLLRQALSEIQEIWKSNACWEVQWQDYRIRKMTPLSCWRLMGFDDESFRRAEQVNSNSQLYKQAGNSIVVDVLMAILKELLNE